MVLISGLLAVLGVWGFTGTMIGLAENDRKKRLEIQFCPYHRATLDEFQPKKISVYFSKSKHSQRSKIIKAGLCNSEHALSM